MEVNSIETRSFSNFFVAVVFVVVSFVNLNKTDSAYLQKYFLVSSSINGFAVFLINVVSEQCTLTKI